MAITNPKKWTGNSNFPTIDTWIEKNNNHILQMNTLTG